MPYRTVPLNIIGGENDSRSGFWSSQSSVNLYVDVQQSGRTPGSLMPWPGEKNFLNNSSEGNRGLAVYKNELYQVAGNSLYKISSDGISNKVGTIPDTKRCDFVEDSNNLIIRTDTRTVIYNGSTVSEITDTDLVRGKTLAYLNTQVIYQGEGDQFAVSDAGNPSSISGLNYGSAETVGDNLLQVYSFQERLYLAGERSIEVWYNTGVGNPPFSRIQGSSANVGVSGSYTMANSENQLYFLSGNGVVYRTSSYQPENITPSSIAKTIRDQGNLGEAVGKIIKLDSQSFYILQLENITLCYSEQTNQWTSISTGQNIGKHLFYDYAYCYGNHYVADRRNGNVYQWDFDTNTSNGNYLIRQRDTAPISSLGRRLNMRRIELQLETGTGNLTNVNPQISIQLSFDGGKSFTSEEWINIGRSSERVKKIEWYYPCSFIEAVVRVKISDPNFISLHGGFIDIKDGGRG